MNEFFATLILAVVQGISEWFPISSSGHLVLASKLLGYSNTLQLDVTLHFGTLMAVFVYFGQDIMNIIEDLLKGKWTSKHAKMGFYLIVATIPAGIAGFLFRHVAEDMLNNLSLLAFGFAITSVLLVIASLDFGKRAELGYVSALLVGFGQSFSIFRGISRSATTISSGLIGGLDEKEAIRFSFLLSIPIIFGANLLENGTRTLPREYLVATLVSFLVGMATIHLMLKIVVNSKKNLRWFALYCFLLALSLAFYLLFW